ncbi:MAG: transglutaminase TgpA family protein [Terriglobia bacterium]
MVEDIKTYQDISASQQRHISVQRFFEISLLLMLGTAFLTLSSTGKLDFVSIVLFSVALGIKLWSYVRGESGYLLQARTVNRAAIGYLFFFLFDLAFLESGSVPADRMLSATVHMILFITVMKIFSARRYRDYAYLAALSFLMMLAGAVLTAGSGYLMGLALYVLFSICMFISFDIKSGMDWARQPPRGPYAEASRNRIAIENSLVVTAIELALGTTALAAILFFIIPRYHTSYLGNFASEAGSVTGFSDSVRLGEIGRIKRSNLVVMRIQPQGGPRAFQGVYWRGIALTSFTGRTWYNENTERVRLAPAGDGNFVLPRPDGWRHRPHRLLRYRVLLSNVSTDVLFTAAQPVEVTGPFPAIALDETWSLHNPRHAGAPVEYAAISDAGLPTQRQLRLDGQDTPSEIRMRYLNLPELDPRIAVLARQITASQSNNYDRALAIQDYLRKNFGYTLDPPSIQPSDPVGSFLFVSRKGYCAYFAAAMTLMLRTLRVPARVVNGFQTGDYNPVARDFIVRARDAHSWVEVYFPTYGWVPFDPTPPGPSDAAALSRLDDYLDAASLFWNEWVINYDSAHQMILGQKVDHDSHQVRLGARRWLSGLRTRGSRWAAHTEVSLMAHRLLLCLGSALLAGYWLLDRHAWLDELRFRYGPRFSRRWEGSAQQAALTYRQLLKILRRKGIERLPAQTPRELALSLSPFPVGAAVNEFTRLYNALRFGHEPVPRERFLSLLDELTVAFEAKSHRA